MRQKCNTSSAVWYLINISRPGNGCILQTTYVNLLILSISIVFWLKFHWSLFQRVQLTIKTLVQMTVSIKAVVNMRQAIMWQNNEPVKLRIYVSPRLNAFYSYFSDLPGPIAQRKHKQILSGLNLAKHPAISLQWRHNECNGVSNHRWLDHLLNCLFRHRSNKKIKAPRRWPLRGESTGHRWIPLTRGQ